MKTIYLFEYQFKQEGFVFPKDGRMNYKSYVIVESETPDVWVNGEYVKYVSREAAITKFVEKYPHVNVNTVKISIFKGDIIDSCEPAN